MHFIENIRRRFQAAMAPMDEITKRQSVGAGQAARPQLSQPLADGSIVPNVATCVVNPTLLDGGVAQRLGLGTGLASHNRIGRTVPVLAGSYDVYAQMSRDPTFALAIAAANAPIMGARWGFEADDGVPDDLFNTVRDEMTRWRSHIVRGFLRAREYGWAAFEKVFEVNEQGNTVFRKIKELWLPRTKILTWSDNGDFAGFAQDAKTIDPDRAVLYTHDLICDDYYGHPLHENGLRAWSNWLATIDNASRLQHKVSGVIIQLHYPVGETEDTAGNIKDNSEIAQWILDRVAMGDSVSMPNLFYAEAGATANMADMAGKSMWVLSVLNVGDSSASAAVLDTDRRYWDVQKLRSWLVPERAVTEGQFGTKAEAEAHADILLAVAQQEHENIVRAVNPQLTDDLAQYNGKAARRIRATADPIDPERRALMKQFFVALWTNPAILELMISGGEFGKPIDVDAIIDQSGFPRGEQMRQLITNIANNAQQIQQNAGALPAPNGNGNVPQPVADRIAGIYRTARQHSNGNGN